MMKRNDPLTEAENNEIAGQLYGEIEGLFNNPEYSESIIDTVLMVTLAARVASCTDAPEQAAGLARFFADQFLTMVASGSRRKLN